MNGTQERQSCEYAQNAKARIGTKKKLTQEYLKSILDYDPETGVFTNKVKRNNRALKGHVAGTKDCKGYIVTFINRKSYKNHRLAWLYVHGYFPENDIDHINKNRCDNRMLNLREVSRSCNLRNSGVRSDNKMGVTGVSWDKRKNKWFAHITVCKKYRFLGYYKSMCNAVCARLAAEQCIDYTGCYVNSSAFKYVQGNNFK